ncbi:hypothetical protein LCGC14_2591810 [marine sediment metagenome]|uniref:N-acetyltransferase domain-containing protein n=1 Tax=marine sediment metagenome TaxID=412755 RepID=A0A0F9ABP4_9ZZZZ
MQSESPLSFTPLETAGDDIAMAILRIRNEPAVRGNMYGDAPITEATHRAWLAGLAGNTSRRAFAALLDGRCVGFVGFTDIQPDHGRADWAFYLTGDVQGMGLGKALERAALRHAFGPLALNKLNCEVLEWNTPVIGLHRKFGFVEEGRRRAHIRRGGAYHDAVLLGLTRDDWRKQETDHD